MQKLLSVLVIAVAFSALAVLHASGAKACQDGGLQGLVIVAKHHDGFCLWPTKTTGHNITRSPFRGETDTALWMTGAKARSPEK